MFFDTFTIRTCNLLRPSKTYVFTMNFNDFTIQRNMLFDDFQQSTLGKYQAPCPSHPTILKCQKQYIFEERTRNILLAIDGLDEANIFGALFLLVTCCGR